MVNEGIHIKKIVEILKSYEEALSDGYEYHSKPVDETLEGIAKKIMEAIDNPMQKIDRFRCKDCKHAHYCSTLSLMRSQKIKVIVCDYEVIE